MSRPSRAQMIHRCALCRLWSDSRVPQLSFFSFEKFQAHMVKKISLIMDWNNCKTPVELGGREVSRHSLMIFFISTVLYFQKYTPTFESNHFRIQILPRKCNRSCRLPFGIWYFHKNYMQIISMTHRRCQMCSMVINVLYLACPSIAGCFWSTSLKFQAWLTTVVKEEAAFLQSVPLRLSVVLLGHLHERPNNPQGASITNAV